MGFPRVVYKRGTGKAVDANGQFSAEAVLLKSEDDLLKLEGEWCDSPAEAAPRPVKDDRPKPAKAK